MRTGEATAPSPRLYLTGWAVTTLGTGIVFPLTAVYLRDQQGMPVGAVSAYFGLFAIAGLVANPFAGMSAARFGPGRIAVVATLFQTVGPLFLVAHGPLVVSLTAAVFSGAGTGIFYGVLTPLLLQLFGEAKLGRVLAAQNAVSAASVGVGALVGGMLVEVAGATGYRLSFLANGISFLIYGMVLAAVLRRTRRRAAAAGVTTRPPRRAGAWTDTLAPFVDRRFLGILLLQGMLVVFGFGQIESVTPIVLRDSAQLQVAGISVVLAVNSLSVIVLQALVVRVTERIGHVRSLLAALGCWTLSAVALWSSAAVAGSVAGVVLAAGWALLFALGECLIAPTMQPLVVATAPPDRLASYTASTSLLHSLGNLTAPALCLSVFTAFGFGAYLGLQFAGYVVAGTVLVVSARAVTASESRPASVL